MILSLEPSAAEAAVTVAPATNDPASAATRIIAAMRFLTGAACAFIDRPFQGMWFPSIRGGIRGTPCRTRSQPVHTHKCAYRLITRWQPVERVDSPRAGTSRSLGPSALPGREGRGHIRPRF